MRHQEAAALKAELQQTTAAAEAVAHQHQQALQQLQEAHSAQLTHLGLQHKAQLEQQGQAAAVALAQQQEQLAGTFREQLRQAMVCVHDELGHLQQQQQEVAAAGASAQVECEHEVSALVDSLEQPLLDLKSELQVVSEELLQLLSMAAKQQAALQELQEQQASLAPEGLTALAQQAHDAATAR